MAGLDGVLNRIDPGEPLDKNIYELPPEEAHRVPKVPASRGEALHSLDTDHDVRLRGDVAAADFRNLVVERMLRGSESPLHGSFVKWPREHNTVV